ncbi:MAG TPA: AI-2E family transporter [Acidimicrobiales bacterium]|nr:AI-2E family transporter [Acidimicrobiales bacterium]
MADSQPSVPQWLIRWAAAGWRLLILAGVLVAASYVFTKLRVIILPMLVGLFVSTIFVPPATWLRRHRFPPLLATWTVLLGFTLIVAGVVWGLYTVTQGQFNQLGHELSAGVNRAERYFTNGPFHFSHKQVNDYVSQARNFFTKNQGTIARGALSGVSVAGEIVAGVVLTLVLVFFFVKDGDRMTNWALSLFSARRVEDVRTLGGQIWATMTAYIRGTSINGLVNAVLLSCALIGLGVPLVLPIAVLTFVGGYLPMIGAIVSGAFAALVALVVKGPITALIVIGVTIVIHNLEGYIVGPKVLGHQVNLHPVVVILSITAGTALAGIPGAFLAVPTTSMLIVVYNHFHHPSQVEALEDERGPPPAEAEYDGSTPHPSSPAREPGARSLRRRG